MRSGHSASHHLDNVHDVRSYKTKIGRKRARNNLASYGFVHFCFWKEEIYGPEPMDKTRYFMSFCEPEADGRCKHGVGY